MPDQVRHDDLRVTAAAGQHLEAPPALIRPERSRGAQLRLPRPAPRLRSGRTRLVPERTSAFAGCSPRVRHPGLDPGSTFLPPLSRRRWMPDQVRHDDLRVAALWRVNI